MQVPAPSLGGSGYPAVPWYLAPGRISGQPKVTQSLHAALVRTCLGDLTPRTAQVLIPTVASAR